MELSAQKVGNYAYTIDSSHANGTWHEEMGYGLIDAYRSVLMAKYYDCYANVNRILEYLQQDTIINDTLLVRNDITIPAGKTLTVQGVLKMFPDTRIYVKAGGKLVVNNGTITNYRDCNMNEYWGGIYVEGQTDKPQIEEFQGIVELNNAVIENSRLAISTQNFPNNWTKTGGIIQAENTIFKNNINNIKLLPYRNYSLEDTTQEIDNVSYFKMCTFVWNDSILPMTDTVLNHIKLHNVKGVSVIGSTFKNDMTTNDVLTHGIISEGSTFSCDWFIRFNQRANIIVDTFYTMFKDLSYGIRANNSETENKTFSVTNTRFIDNYCGVFATNINDINITRNYFFIKYTSISNYSWGGLGLSLENCTGYTVANNSLKASNNIQESYTVGIQIKNSGSDVNFVNNNEIQKLHYGTQSIGDNSGLQYTCNSFTNNYYGIYAYNIQGSSFLCSQGSSTEAVYNLYVNQSYADICSNIPPSIVYYYPENTPSPTICTNVSPYSAPAPEPCGTMGIGDDFYLPPFGPIIDPNPGFGPRDMETNLLYDSITAEYESLFFANRESLEDLAQEDNSFGVRAKQILYFKGIDLSFHPIIPISTSNNSSILNKTKEQITEKGIEISEEYILTPNPANNEVEIKTANREKNTKQHITTTENTIKQVTILDLQGKELKTFDNTTTFNIASLKPGTYLLKIKDGENKLHYQKLVKR